MTLKSGANEGGYKRTGKFAAALLALLVISGCAQWKERKNVRDAVVRYNTLLADGYRKLNMGPVNEAATEDIAARAFYHMAALGEARIKMDPALKSITFSRIKLFSDKAEASTEEKWDYTYINLDTGKPEFQNSITYEMRYLLKKVNGRWLVAGVVSGKFKEKKDPRGIFFQRPAAKP